MKNTHPIDRWLRLALAIGLAQWAYFWLTSAAQWPVYAVAAILGGTALLQFCPVYRWLGVSTASRSSGEVGMAWKALGWAALLALLVGGSYGSAAFSRKLFLEEFNAMNHFYKQTLFLTGKNEREKANADYDRLMPAWLAFQSKYTKYRPYALRTDTQLSADLVSVQAMLSGVEPAVRSGDLHQAHLDLEKVRPAFQDMLKRNGFSLLSVALVDFHDNMEQMLDAAQARDVQKIIQLYPAVSDKLRQVEEQANDAEIQAIRQHLDALMAMAQADKRDGLSGQADKLKSSFVKVYLQRG